jgi:hypothetical protein
MQKTGAIQEIELPVFLGCTLVDFGLVAVAVGLISAMIVDF